ncbi:GerMN domain-containing protein [Heliorestis convoluta]|uniref:Spore germination protein, putative n=1 Tax=Heliorestis convoluta TaxID=356322 RepID=A0A5Q2N1U5_9FIRM|nr:GerMN domain-containing protein [Heliorestis convoluta]QGG49354.1 spore germination protein, putative [Heliorestis convoluta]
MDKDRSWSAGIILLVTALVIAFGLGGCQAIDRYVSMKQDFKAKETGVIPTEGTVVMEQETFEQSAELDMDNPPFLGEQYILTLYFADSKGQNLVAEERSIPKTESLARSAVQELIKGPNLTQDASPTVPTGTRLLDINIRDGICIIDLSKEFKTNHEGGSAGETLTVYSIVNTLTQFPTVEKVQFLVEGQIIESIAGHMDVSQAMARHNAMIAE